MTTTTDDTPLVQNIHALEARAAYRFCPELGVVYVRGDDRVSWLNGQVTNDVREIGPGDSVHALAVNVRGKIMAELQIADLGEALVLVVHHSAQAALLESFERYIIMEDVTLEPAPSQHVLVVVGAPPDAVAAHAPASMLSFTSAWLGRAGRLWIGEEAGLQQLAAQLAPTVPPIDETAGEVVRLRRALPRYGVDYDEHHYPQEVGLKALVSFQKGCYLGQEVVCTLENRGKLSRHLCVLHGEPGVALQDLVAGVPLTADGRTPLHAAANTPAADPAGWITSSAWDPEQGRCLILAYVRRNHAKPGATLYAGAQPLTLVSLVGETGAQPSAT